MSTPFFIFFSIFFTFLKVLPFVFKSRFTNARTRRFPQSFKTLCIHIVESHS